MKEIICQHLKTMEDFRKLNVGDKCLVKDHGVLIIREFNAIEFLGEKYGTWISFKSSQSSNFKLADYIDGTASVTDVIYIQ